MLAEFLRVWLGSREVRKGELLGSVGHDMRSRHTSFCSLDPRGSSAAMVAETWNLLRCLSEPPCRSQVSHRIAKVHPTGDY